MVHVASYPGAMHSHAGLAGYRLIKPRATPHGPSTAAEEVGQPPHRLTGRPTAHRAISDSLTARWAAEDELGDLGEGGVVGRVEVAGADRRQRRRVAGDGLRGTVWPLPSPVLRPPFSAWWTEVEVGRTEDGGRRSEEKWRRSRSPAKISRAPCLNWQFIRDFIGRSEVGGRTSEDRPPSSVLSPGGPGRRSEDGSRRSVL